MKSILKIVLVILVIGCADVAYANATFFSFDPAWRTVTVGDIFTVDVKLNNADSTVFDSLSAWIGYDTTYLEIQDADAGTSGVQIQRDPDGTFGFNYHAANSVNTSEGKIDFQEGILGGTSNKAGTFAAISFKALGPISSTALTFEFNTWGMFPNTSLLRSGNDVLGDVSDAFDGTTDGGVGINMIPEPTSLSLSLIGSALISFLRLTRKRR